MLLSVRTPQIFERVSDDAKEDSGASEENAQSSGYGGGTAGGQFGGFDNINDMFGKFAKSFQNGGKSPFQKTAKPKKQFDHSNLKLLIFHCGKTAYHRRGAVLPDGRREFLPETV